MVGWQGEGGRGGVGVCGRYRKQQGTEKYDYRGIGSERRTRRQNGIMVMEQREKERVITRHWKYRLRSKDNFKVQEPRHGEGGYGITEEHLMSRAQQG